MVSSLPWAIPWLGYRKHLDYVDPLAFETRGFLALLISIVGCASVGGLLLWLGRKAEGKLYRKEAMAVVGLSWVVATVLGAMPFYFCGCVRDVEPVTGAHIRMNVVDCLFESQSGFSTTGATVISQLEDPALVPHCILFWRSTTHFLGGLGIIVLFVVLLGHGSTGKALMRAEMPGPTKEGSTPRMQDTAWLFALTYVGLNVALTIILWMLDLSLFDAACHAFGTMATGGFSTYNASLGHFDSPAIEYIVVVFMILAGTNFTLLFYLIVLKPKKLLADIEWRTYMGIIGVVTVLVVAVGMYSKDFSSWDWAVRDGLFQVVSIMTTTGYGTVDFDIWNHFGRGVLFMLMFVGGCAGSTGGGMKVIRHVLFVKVLGLEIEQSYHPTVVRPLRLGGKPVDDPQLRKNILVYFSLILAIFVFGWMFVVMLEPDATWVRIEPDARVCDTSQHKLLDSASSIAATLNNIGPGLGTVGATRNYGHFSWWSKTLFLWLMMIGRLEIFSILVLFVPGFWRSR
jgi:trk system potassium uptake protein TrkH